MARLAGRTIFGDKIGKEACITAKQKYPCNRQPIDEFKWMDTLGNYRKRFKEHRDTLRSRKENNRNQSRGYIDESEIHKDLNKDAKYFKSSTVQPD